LFDGKKGTNPIPWAKNPVFQEELTDLDQKSLIRMTELHFRPIFNDIYSDWPCPLNFLTTFMFRIAGYAYNPNHLK